MSVPADRPLHLLERVSSPFPLPPLNVFCQSAYEKGAIDLRWDDPSVLAQNSRFHILGVNIYRSFDSEFGPFSRINDVPLGSGFYRDTTTNALVEEDVSDQFLLRDVKEDPANPGRFVFRVRNFPIVIPESQNVPTRNPRDVRVWVNGSEVPVIMVIGETGEVSIDPWLRADIPTQTAVRTVPTSPSDVVLCAYRYNVTYLNTALNHRIFYRFTAVGYDTCSTGSSLSLVETPLEVSTSTHLQEIEKLDYIWREAIRRNRWILDQGGERVKVFLRKTNGAVCPCWPDTHHRQPISDCVLCYGSGFLGGYEGPFDLVIAPDDNEKKFTRTVQGTVLEHNQDVWTGPSPMLSQRDFLVKQNGDRYSVGSVRMPSNRGNVLQQHFPIGRLMETDIRYKVPVTGGLPPLTIKSLPFPESYVSPEVTEKENIPDEREERGRTKVWENIVYLGTCHEKSQCRFEPGLETSDPWYPKGCSPGHLWLEVEPQGSEAAGAFAPDQDPGG